MYLTIEQQDDWTATVRLHIAWALPARFDDGTQKRSEEMEWNTIDHYITLRSGHALVEDLGEQHLHHRDAEREHVARGRRDTNGTVGDLRLNVV